MRDKYTFFAFLCDFPPDFQADGEKLTLQLRKKWYTKNNTDKIDECTKGVG